MFYTYIYRDPRPTKMRQPVYVGKGQGRRAWQHWEKRRYHNTAFNNFLTLLRREGLEPIIEIVQDGLEEAEAFFEEIRLIALYGRRDLKTGSLFNLTDGGEGFAGAVRTESWRARMSAAMSTEAQVLRSSTNASSRWADPSYRERTVTAIRIALKDPEVIARREAGKAAFIHTDAFRETMSAATSKMWQDPAYAEKVVERQKQVQGTPEARANKAAASASTWKKADVREKRATGIKATRSTEESRAKTRAQGTAQWADPEYRRLQTERNKEIANRPENRAARSAALRARWADPVWKAEFMAKREKKKQEREAVAAVQRQAEQAGYLEQYRRDIIRNKDNACDAVAQKAHWALYYKLMAENTLRPCK